jgi:hypothetical protein
VSGSTIFAAGPVSLLAVSIFIVFLRVHMRAT